jgi:hypothetical protein
MGAAVLPAGYYRREFVKWRDGMTAGDHQQGGNSGIVKESGVKWAACHTRCAAARVVRVGRLGGPVTMEPPDGVR